MWFLVILTLAEVVDCWLSYTKLKCNLQYFLNYNSWVVKKYTKLLKKLVSLAWGRSPQNKRSTRPKHYQSTSPKGVIQR